MTSAPFKFELGETLKDIITGFHGVVMGRTQYATGCNHYGLVSRDLDKDGKPKDWQWFDESRLVSVPKAGKVKFNLTKPTGGPYPNAPEV